MLALSPALHTAGTASYDTRVALSLTTRSLQAKLSIITLLIVGASLFVADFVDRHYVAELARENFRSKSMAFLRQVDLAITSNADLHNVKKRGNRLRQVYEANPELLLLQLYARQEGQAGPSLLASHGVAAEPESPAIPSEVSRLFAMPERGSDFHYDAGTHRMGVARPISVNKQIVGVVYGEVWTGQFDAVLGHHRRWSLVIRFVAGTLIVMAINLFLYFHVHTPLHSLQVAFGEVADQKLSATVPVHREDEIGQVANQFNLMVDQLRRAAQENQRLYLALKHANESLQGRVELATAELLQRNEELEKLNELLSTAQRESARVQRLAVLGQTVAMVAHRIGTPLTAISGHIQLLAEEPGLSQLTRDRLQTVMGQIERMSRIIQDLLTLARKPDGHLTQLDVNVVLEQTLNLFRPLIEQQKIELYTTFGDDLCPVQGDPAELQEVFGHLIDNALEAMPQGGRLAVETSREPVSNTDSDATWVRVEIRDTGIGIQPEHLEHIFEPFFTSKGTNRGTGLGLAIAYEIIRRQGGRVTVASEPGKGSSFRILLSGPTEKST